ncbi:uncharacterized protein LOC122197374 [Lactuca sativa]|uniref:uncharacterized protein LOC122197374 n=1 Tax=Lactuca sativa TaxID=4236 RepID=UPI001C68DE8D|nr:uncharacterized protein LOC122197374 [Lactuca sativa]
MKTTGECACRTAKNESESIRDYLDEENEMWKPSVSSGDRVGGESVNIRRCGRIVTVDLSELRSKREVKKKEAKNVVVVQVGTGEGGRIVCRQVLTCAVGYEN